MMEAPERIWVHDASEGTPETWDVYDNGGVEYVRADRKLPPELVERIEVAIPKWQLELEIAEACSWGDMADEIQEIVDLLRKILEEVTHKG